jgi:hypothetical protein
MIDPLLLGSMHAEMPRNEELMYAMNGMASMPPEYANVGYQISYQTARPSSPPQSYGSADTGSPQSGISVNSSQAGAVYCRYPVLKPLSPHLGAIMSVSTACDLLEYYFQSSSSVFMEPVSPYILGTVFRKRSFLRRRQQEQSYARSCGSLRSIFSNLWSIRPLHMALHLVEAGSLLQCMTPSTLSEQ